MESNNQNRWKRFLYWCAKKFTVVAGLFLVLYLYFYITSPIYFNRSEEVRKSVELGVAFTQPGLQVGSGGSSNGLFGNIKFNYELSKRLGDHQWNAGNISDNTINLLGNSVYTYKWIPKRRTNYVFELPKENGVGSTSNSQKIWESLERLPSGTVAEMAFSLDKYYDVIEVPKLHGVNLAISWYALDTGEQVKMKEAVPRFVINPFGIDVDYWIHNTDRSMTQGISSKESSGKLLGSSGGGYTIKQPPFPDGYLDKVAWLAERPKLFRAVAPSVQTESPIEKRYQYLKEHGLKTYGIVVHGPVKELLALRETPQLRNPQFGPVEWWLP